MINKIFFRLYSIFRKPSSNTQLKDNVDIDLVRLFFDKNNEDSKSVFIDEQTADDLDINELFFRVNDTSSKIGEQYLYNTLRRPFNNIEALKLQHNLSEEIRKNFDLKNALKNNLRHINKYKDYHIYGFLRSGKFIKPNWYRFISYSHVIAILFAIGSFFYFQFLLIFLPIFFFNFYLHYSTKQKYWDYFTTMARLATLFQVSVNLHKLMPRVDGEMTSTLKYVKKFILQSRFLKIVDSLQSSELGQIAWLAIEIINMLFLFEVKYVYSFNEKMEKYRNSFLSLYHYVGKIDTALSIASYRNTLDYYSLPNFSDKDSYVSLKDVKHPLVKNCVSNNILLDTNLIFINGSNMSGKTTFMRTIGINVLLARTIYTCLATKAELSLFNIHSSMRISDDLAKSQSYFISELIRLREFVEICEESPQPNLFLIDEILKGTNAVDRMNISNSILKFLQANKKNMTIATSHDIDIVKNINENISKFHFDEDILDNKMVFDYTIKAGLTHKKNAVKILKLLEFPGSIINKALSG